MKLKVKEMLSGICVLLIIAAGVVFLMHYQKGKERNDLAKRIAALGRGGPPETIEGLKTAIAAYERQIEQHVKDAAQVGIYWKILAARLQEKGLHNEALQALERAIYYNPGDSSLHYMTGVSAGIAANSVHNFSGREAGERERYLTLAEDAYLTAISLDDRYLRPRYGLAVLYVFELDRPAEAIPHLLRFLEISKNDVDAMFILARAYYATGEFRAALDLYDRIIAVTKDKDKKAEAERNRTTVMRAIYG